jgi:hypothetical protein
MDTTSTNDSVKTFEVWLESEKGIIRTVPARKIATIKGTSFNAAMRLYIGQLTPAQRAFWKFDPMNLCWRFSGVRLYNGVPPVLNS